MNEYMQSEPILFSHYWKSFAMHLTFALFSLPLLSSLASALNTSPPCIKSCYDANPGTLRWCQDVPTMTDEILSRCTCSSFGAQPPLYTCLKACPASEIAIYISGPNDWCFGEFFPGVQAASTTMAGSTRTTAAATQTGTISATGAATTRSVGAGTGSGAGAGRALPTMLAIGGVVLGLIY